jgi:hypothetical protein
MKKIFIGGCDRSGTTFLARLLSQVDGAVATPESQFKTEYKSNSNIGIAAFLKSHWRVKNWLSDNELGCIDFEKSESSIYEDMVRMYSSKKFDQDNPSLWIDHTPNNLRHAKRINDLWSDSYFIHIVRDGRGVASSVIPLDWGPNTAQAAASFWLQKLSFGFMAESLYFDKSIRVRYEDLVSNTDKVLFKIYEFIDVKPSLDKNLKIELPNYTKNQHSHVLAPPNIELINSWKKKLTEREVFTFEKHAGEMLEMLGYRKTNTNLDISKVSLGKDILRELLLFYVVNPKKYRRNRDVISSKLSKKMK